MTTARLQRYAIFLSSHNFSIEYRKTAQQGNADGLSRLPLALSNTDSTNEDVDTVYYASQLESLPMSCDRVRKETQRDYILSQVLRGSFKKYVDFYHNFFSRRHITLRFGTHIWTTNSVDLTEKFLNLTRYF